MRQANTMCESVSEKEQVSPSSELAPSGPTCKRCRTANPAGCGRCSKCGAFISWGPITHGVNSRQRSLLLAPIRQEMRAAILSDLGHTDADAPRALSIVVEQFIEARLIAQSYFEFLASSGGPITTKGRQRRAVAGWATASTHVTRLAPLIGLTRRPRKIDESPIEWLERIGRQQQQQKVEANDEHTPEEEAGSEE